MLIISLTFSIVVMALGILGNIGVLVFSMATKFFKSAHVTSMVVFDILSILTGPGMFFLSFFIKTKWLAFNSLACSALGFLQNATACCSFFGLFSVICYGRQLHRFFPSVILLRSNLVASWVWSLAVASPPLMGWNSYSYHSHVKSCFYSTENTNSGYSYSYFMAALSFSFHGLIVIYSYLSVRNRRGYRMKLQWQRHKKELSLNDPERTTFASSQSEMSGVNNSIEMLLATLANAKLHSKVDEEPGPFHGSRVVNELEDTKEPALHSTFKRPSHTDDPEDPDGSNFVLPQNTPHVKVDHRRSEVLIDSVQDREKVLGRACPAAYTICLNDNKFHAQKLHKFKGTISLEEISQKEDRIEAQFLRMLFALSCLSLIGWCPYYVATILSLISGSVPESLWVAAYWMRYIRPVLCPILLPVCCDDYKQAVVSGAGKIKKAVFPCCNDLGEKKHYSVELDKAKPTEELADENKEATLTKMILFPS